MLHLYGKMLYDYIQLSYVANQTSMDGSWLIAGTKSTDLMVNRCHAISARFW